MKINHQAIRNLRINKGLTLKDVAVRLNVTEGTVSRYESGQIQRVSPKVMLGYSKLFDVPINYLYENAETEWVKALEEAGLHDPRVAGFIEYLEEQAKKEAVDSLELNENEINIALAYRAADEQAKRIVRFTLGIKDNLEE
jgi:transcriptional regulator with XRE-family HTH domain